MGLQAEFRSGFFRLLGVLGVLAVDSSLLPRRQERQGRLYGVESSVWLQSVKLRVLGGRVQGAGYRFKSGATVSVA